MRRTFTIVLDPDPIEGGYTVTVPALPGIVTQGASYEDALAMAEDAIRCHVEGLLADGVEVPEESAEPTLARVTVSA